MFNPTQIRLDEVVRQVQAVLKHRHLQRCDGTELRDFGD